MTTTATLAESFRACLEKRVRPPAGALVSYVVEAGGGRHTLHAALSEVPRPARACHRYPRLTTGEAWLELAKFKALLAAAGEGEALIGDLRLEGAAQSHYLQPHDEVRPCPAKRPGWLLTVQWPSQGAWADGAHLSFGAPPFADTQTLLSAWLDPLGDLVAYASLDRWNIWIPDDRATFSDVSWTDNLLTLAVAGERASEVEVQGIFARQGAARPREATRLAGIGPVVQIEVPDDVDVAELFLVSRTDGLLARTYAFREAAGDTTDADLTREAVDDIEGGENDTVEFKPWIRKGHEKEDEIVRTCVAFANTHGGTIYFGVLDDGTLDESKTLIREYTDATTAGTHFRRLVRERVGPTPECTMSIVRYAGADILAMKIDRESSGVHRCLRTRTVFVRRGSTNSRANPDEIAQLAAAAITTTFRL